MMVKKFGSKYIVRIDKGEEIVACLKKICTDNKIRLGSVSGIGAVGRAQIGLFETSSKQYHSTDLESAFEITSLNGNISTMNGEVYLHLHINLSDAAYHTFGGHFQSAVVSGTCEIIIDAIDGECERIFNEDVGLNIIR
jgi:hypothetical protein